MGANLATIGVIADTSDLATGQAALEQFAQAGEETEKKIGKAGKGVSGSMKKVSTDTKSAASGIKQVGTAATGSAAQLNNSGGAARNYANQVKGASMQTANLTAQFNDIGVMLAAGQNPLMLAMQQGTQINQVFQQMGGGVGAIKSLGPALMSMVSPMSLLTLGAIAGGAALIQWGMGAIGAGEKALTLDEKIEALTEKLSSWQSMLDEIADNEALAERFGRDADAAKEFLEEITRITAGELQQGFADALGDMNDPFGLEDTMAGLQLGSVADQLGMDRPFMVFSDSAREARDEVDALAQSGIDASNQLAAALATGSFDQQKEAAEEMLRVYTQLADADGQRTDAENEYIVALTETVTKMQEFSSSVNGEANEALSNMLSLGQQIGQTWSENVAAQITAYEQAQSLVDAIEKEAELRIAIAQYGADSVEVDQLRADIAMDNLAAKLDELGVTEELKAELLLAADAAMQAAINAEGISSGITTAADEAARLADNLFLASRVGLRQTISDEDLAMSQSLTPAPMTRSIANYNRLTAPRPSRSRSGRTGGAGGVSEAARELKRENDELDRIAASIIASTMTVEQEFVKDFDELSAAMKSGRIDADTYEIAVDNLMAQFADERAPQYAAELERITALYENGQIGQAAFTTGVMELNEAFEETQSTAETMEGALEDMFVSILNGTKTAGEAVADLASKFANMAFEAAFSGVFSGMFGGIANIFTSAKGNAFDGGRSVAFANGGVVQRPTHFPMSNGQTGLMGEAGPEGILPLSRGANGKLGVRADMPPAVSAPNIQGGDVITVSYNPIIDASGADPEAIRRLEEGQARIAGEFEDRVISAVRKGQKRRLL